MEIKKTLWHIYAADLQEKDSFYQSLNFHQGGFFCNEAFSIRLDTTRHASNKKLQMHIQAICSQN